jgi:uncharacterized membrane protein
MLILIRIIYSHTLNFIFIPWNLFLAGIPLFFSFYIEKTKSRLLSWLFACLWLLFFPNAMYIITDLFHLRERIKVPLWYDLLILFSAALNGTIMGFLSLYNIERWLSQKIGRRFIPVISFLFFIGCGYGIYLGRYLRWNSWDIITQPLALLFDIKYDVVHPFRNKGTWLLTGLFAMWMFMLYHYFKKLTGASK